MTDSEIEAADEAMHDPAMVCSIGMHDKCDGYAPNESDYPCSCECHGDRPTCGRCGEPATGYASIDGVRYCHGPDDDIPIEQLLAEIETGVPPSCFELTNGQLGPIAMKWLATHKADYPPEGNEEP